MCVFQINDNRFLKIVQFFVNNYSRAGDGIGSMFPKVSECTVSERDDVIYFVLFNSFSISSILGMVPSI